MADWTFRATPYRTRHLYDGDRPISDGGAWCAPLEIEGEALDIAVQIHGSAEPTVSKDPERHIGRAVKRALDYLAEDAGAADLAQSAPLLIYYADIEV